MMEGVGGWCGGGTIDMSNTTTEDTKVDTIVVAFAV
jgi:hypothetical protein